MNRFQPKLIFHAQHLRELYKASGLTSLEIAEKLGISQRTWNYAIKAERLISDNNIKQLCQAISLDFKRWSWKKHRDYNRTPSREEVDSFLKFLEENRKLRDAVMNSK